VIPNASVIEINNSCSSLSSRPSTRVPFGTGPSVLRLSEQKGESYYTYVPRAFFDLKCLFDSIEQLYDINVESITQIVQDFPHPLKEFIEEQKFFQKIEEINKNTSSLNTFIKRFYDWWDGFKVVKYLNYSHSKHYNKIPLQEAVSDFLKEIDCNYNGSEIKKTLVWFRKLDREGKKLKILS